MAPWRAVKSPPSRNIIVPKNPTPPPTVTNPPRSLINPPQTVIHPPTNAKNPTHNVTRQNRIPEKRVAEKPPNLTSSWLSGFSLASRCTNAPNSTQISPQQNQPLAADFLDIFALIAPSQNCSTWNNLRSRHFLSSCESAPRSPPGFCLWFPAGTKRLPGSRRA
jgi:hypothetical protein